MQNVEKVVPGGNPACWRSGFSFEQCCGAPPEPAGDDAEEGNPECWDSNFGFERCCTLTDERRAAKISFAPPETPHYELQHLFRGNAPRLGPVQDSTFCKGGCSGDRV